MSKLRSPISKYLYNGSSSDEETDFSVTLSVIISVSVIISSFVWITVLKLVLLLSILITLLPLPYNSLGTGLDFTIDRIGNSVEAV